MKHISKLLYLRKRLFSANLFILRDVLSWLELYIIEFHQILPIYSPMHNKHKIKKENVGYFLKDIL